MALWWILAVPWAGRERGRSEVFRADIPHHLQDADIPHHLQEGVREGRQGRQAGRGGRSDVFITDTRRCGLLI